MLKYNNNNNNNNKIIEREMDFSKIKGMLETNESLDIDDNDLEDELNAIISGQPIKSINKSQQKTTPSSSRNVVKPVKQTDYNINDNKLSNKRPNTSRNECIEYIIDVLYIR